MPNKEIIKQTTDYVRKTMSGDASHDWWHVYRVWKTAVNIAKEEKADLFVVQLASLLHDIADWKFHGGDEEVGKARAWLSMMQTD